MPSWLTGEFLIQFLTAVGVSGALTQVISTIRDRRKLGAEAGEILQRAAGAQVERLQKEIDDLRTQRADDRREHDAEIAELRRLRTEDEHIYGTMLNSARTENATLRAHLVLRRQWEIEVFRKLREQGIQLDPPPELNG